MGRERFWSVANARTNYDVQSRSTAGESPWRAGIIHSTREPNAVGFRAFISR